MISDVREYRLPASFFSDNRKRLLEKLPENCCVFLFAGEPVFKTDGAEYRFRADRNFYYLCGINQEDSVLLIQKDGANARTSLFIHSNDPMKERWTGKRLTPKEALERSGADEATYLETLEDRVSSILDDSSSVIASDSGFRPGPASRFFERVKKTRGEEGIFPITPILTRFRMKKHPCEIEMIRKAVELTDLSIRESLELIKRGTSELQLYTSMNGTMSRCGCLEPAFPTIVAAGENAFYLHHSEPCGQAIPKGVMIQTDVGAEVAGLCADISRAFPSSGIFSERQSALYEAVLHCQEEVFRAIRPGVTLADINKTFRQTAIAALRDLQIIEEEDASIAGEYLWHNVAHHLGMDVHDTCMRDVPLEANAVLAVEPGIYVREWGTGFRIEDDVLVTDNGCEILSSYVCRERHEIERLLTMSGGM